MTYESGIDSALIGNAAMLHVEIINPSTRAVVYDIYKHFDTAWPAVVGGGPPDPKQVATYPGRFPGDYRVKVSVASAVPPVGEPPSSGFPDAKRVNYHDGEGVQLSDTERPWKLCVNPMAAEPCSLEVTLKRSFTTDSAEMELQDWSEPPCFTKQYEGGCATDETFMLFEYTPGTTQFVTAFKMDALVPGIRKDDTGGVIAVEPWSVSIDVVPGSADALRSAMGLPGANSITPIAGDQTCRTYEQADAHAKTLGYRHNNAHTVKNQFPLAQPFIATKDTLYTIRVKLGRGVTAPACAKAADAFAIGILGRDAGNCKEQCTLYGMPPVGGVDSDCILGCKGAHPTLVTDPNLCAEMVCCGKSLCGSTTDFSAKNVNCAGGDASGAEIGCSFAASLHSASNDDWLNGKSRTCDAYGELYNLIDHNKATGTGDHGIGLEPPLQEDAPGHAAGSKIAISCVGEKPLLEGACDTYTCDRGTYVGSAGGKFEGCQFQDHCIQGCMRSDLEDEKKNFLMNTLESVVEPFSKTQTEHTILCNPNPTSMDLDGAYEGSATYVCNFEPTSDGGVYVWEQVLGDGKGTGKCTYVAAVVTTQAPITLDPADGMDIDAAGNIVKRTSTLTSTTVTTENEGAKTTTTTTVVLVERPAIEVSWSDVDFDVLTTQQLYRWRSKTEDVLTNNTNLERNDILFFTYETDGTNSNATVHFKEAAVTNAEVQVASEELAKYLVTAAVQISSAIAERKHSSMTATFATTSMYSANLADLKRVDPLMTAAASGGPDGGDGYDNDEISINYDEDTVVASKLTGGEKFGLAILIILIIAMIASIGYMAHKMQTHPKYKKQSAYSGEGQASIPMMELDPFNQSSSSTDAVNKPRSIHAMRRQSQLAAQQSQANAYAGNGGPATTFLRTSSGQNFAPGQSTVESQFNRAPTQRPAVQNVPRQLTDYPSAPKAGVAQGNQRKTVQLRPQPPRATAVTSAEPFGAGGVGRSITEQAELGLEELEPAVFGTAAGQQSVRARPQSGIAGTAQVGFTNADQLSMDATIAEGSGAAEPEVFL